MGYRNLTPVLRQQQDLLFDVMPMPRISQKATTAALQGLCISEESAHVDEAADFLTYLVSDKSAGQLAATGYAMPTNLAVLTGEEFRQSTQQPFHADVFVKEVRNARPLPDVATWPAVAANAGLGINDLFYQPVIDPLADRLEAIDRASMPIFDPRLVTSGSPSGSPSGDPSASPSGSPSSGASGSPSTGSPSPSP
jgi:multiple sugar transport system substrate-binding protein